MGRPACNLVNLWTAPAAPVNPKLNPPELLAGGSVRISFTSPPSSVLRRFFGQGALILLRWHQSGSWVIGHRPQDAAAFHGAGDEGGVVLGEAEEEGAAVEWYFGGGAGGGEVPEEQGVVIATDREAAAIRASPGGDACGNAMNMG